MDVQEQEPAITTQKSELQTTIQWYAFVHKQLAAASTISDRMHDLLKPIVSLETFKKFHELQTAIDSVRQSLKQDWEAWRGKDKA